MYRRRPVPRPPSFADHCQRHVRMITVPDLGALPLTPGSTTRRWRMRARKFRAGLVLLAVTALGVTAGSGPAAAADYERRLNGTFASGTLDPWWAGSGTT